MAPQQHSQPMFAKDEKALCFHMELLYEAKVLDTRPVDPLDKKSSYEYKVHYKGWKNTWDDWVPQERLRKNNEENRELATNLRKEMESLRNRSNRVVPPTASKRRNDGRASEERASSLAAGRGQKRGRDFEVEKDEPLARPLVRIHIPDRLKSLLVDDWENVTKNLQLVQLPAKVPAGVILDEYAQAERAKRQEGSAHYDLLEEVIAGLKEYFNRCLGRILLYRFEREQYTTIYKQTESPTHELAGKVMSDIYGGEHLLRLFVSLPELIAQTNMDSQSVNRLREELVRITGWLSKDENVRRFFVSEYENPDAAYKEKVTGQNL